MYHTDTPSGKNRLFFSGRLQVEFDAGGNSSKNYAGVIASPRLNCCTIPYNDLAISISD